LGTLAFGNSHSITRGVFNSRDPLGSAARRAASRATPGSLDLASPAPLILSQATQALLQGQLAPIKLAEPLVSATVPDARGAGASHAVGGGRAASSSVTTSTVDTITTGLKKIGLSSRPARVATQEKADAELIDMSTPPALEPPASAAVGAALVMPHVSAALNAISEGGETSRSPSEASPPLASEAGRDAASAPAVHCESAQEELSPAIPFEPSPLAWWLVLLTLPSDEVTRAELEPTLPHAPPARSVPACRRVGVCRCCM